MTQEELKKELDKLPSKPGVYIMKDKEDKILYIGKAVVLKNRVRQYFQSSNHTPRIRTMVSKIDHFETIVTNSELEALILECNLIKEHQPRFNVLLKDDKNYPYIKITENEQFPRIFMTRKIFKDGARYFGPYADVTAVKDILELIKKIFPIRLCSSNRFNAQKSRPCLNYYINQCLAPCQGKISVEEYKNMIHQVYEFLEGKYTIVIDGLEKQMQEASDNMEFEKAAVLRDRISASHKLMQKQRVNQESTDDGNIDVIGMARDDSNACIQVFFVRGGKLINRDSFSFKGMADIESSEILSSFIKQFYNKSSYIPRTILIDSEIQDIEILKQYISLKKNGKVELYIPKKGDKKALLELARKNAYVELERKGKDYSAALEQLSLILDSKSKINTIEAFDISNLSDTAMVGCMIVFNGDFDKSKYKRYKIKTVAIQNDVESMREVVLRRIKRREEMVLPDLMLLDGGKQQLNAVKKELESLSINITVAGMVKDDKHRTRGLVLADGKEIILKDFTHAYKLVSDIQEEVHRFALSFHTKVREKQTFKSQLDDIKGIGQVRKKELFKHFGSIDAIKKASIEELKKVKNFNTVNAKAVYDFYHGK